MEKRVRTTITWLVIGSVATAINMHMMNKRIRKIENDMEESAKQTKENRNYVIKEIIEIKNEALVDLNEKVEILETKLEGQQQPKDFTESEEYLRIGEYIEKLKAEINQDIENFNKKEISIYQKTQDDINKIKGQIKGINNSLNKKGI